MREAVPSPLAGSPRTEPIGSAGLFEHVADGIDQECLRVLGKGKDLNSFHFASLPVEKIVLVEIIDTFKVMYMVIIGIYYSCSHEM